MVLPFAAYQMVSEVQKNISCHIFPFLQLYLICITIYFHQLRVFKSEHKNSLNATSYIINMLPKCFRLETKVVNRIFMVSPTHYITVDVVELNIFIFKTGSFGFPFLNQILVITMRISQFNWRVTDYT